MSILSAKKFKKQEGCEKCTERFYCDQCEAKPRFSSSTLAALHLVIPSQQFREVSMDNTPGTVRGPICDGVQAKAVATSCTVTQVSNVCKKEHLVNRGDYE